MTMRRTSRLKSMLLMGAPYALPQNIANRPQTGALSFWRRVEK